MSDIYDPSRLDYNSISGKPLNSPRSLLSIQILSPKDETITSSPLLNMTITGNMLNKDITKFFNLVVKIFYLVVKNFVLVIKDVKTRFCE